jgi:hypothetical protein
MARGNTSQRSTISAKSVDLVAKSAKQSAKTNGDSPQVALETAFTESAVRTSNPQVAGSIPAGRIVLLSRIGWFYVAQSRCRRWANV